MMRIPSLVLVLVLLGAACFFGVPQSSDERAEEERLSFQTNGPWSPRTNLNADVAMVYGIGPRMPGNIETWRQHGYAIHVMTGVAWGQYQDYLNGDFDGHNHWDEAQQQGAVDNTSRLCMRNAVCALILLSRLAFAVYYFPHLDSQHGW